MTAADKTVFICRECGQKTHKWMGKCPECGQWDTLAEETAAPPDKRAERYGAAALDTRPSPIDAEDAPEDDRLLTGIDEFDRVLGGGLVKGSLVLIGGDPGIGKSTLMLQALHGLARAKKTVLYVSGEESARQIRMRARRLATVDPRILVLSETSLEAVVAAVEREKPDVLVVDSIQTMYNTDLPAAPGTVSQVRESTMRLMMLSKRTGVPAFLVGHVTKDGAIAGPRIMEHMVDTVLYFEGDRNHVFRILRAVKNRFGSTNEIGVFEMKEQGLEEVANPSAVFLSERPLSAPGSVVTASMEGSRPVLVELQALAGSTALGTPRRTVLGLDSARVALLLAVMERRLGLSLAGHDVFMNVAGGVKVDEPSADLAIIAAVASSLLDRPVREGTIVLGEVGLTGEVRAVGRIESRMAEIRKMGFCRCILPASNEKRMAAPDGVEVVGVRGVSKAVESLFNP